ncbi:MAG TPA: signal peptidase I [Stellaceae bacterium]|jgi:signal peptidase I|nr:signal peptidase I [Stellaceae bacterium]
MGSCNRRRWAGLTALLVMTAGIFATAEAMTVFHAVATQMEPTVLKGEAVLIDPEAYRSRPPSRGDVVMLIGPRDKNEHLFRIIGLPGEHIQLRGGQLFIDDREVPRRKIEDYAYHFEASLPAETLTQYVEALPAGSNGEVREHRIVKRDDSGPLNNTKVFAVPPDQYFVLGDNRDNSADSRFDLGFIPIGAITGKAISHAGADIE